MVENTWTYITRLQYPTSKISFYVLDDGADPAVQTLASRFNFNYISRPDRPTLKKAGNL